MNRTLHELIEDRMADADAHGRRRTTVRVDWHEGAEADVDGQPAVVFCSNDYLGLRRHPALIEAARAAAAREGTGGGSSRLIAGTTGAQEELEQELAAQFGSEAALVLSSGYHANLAVLTTLTDAGDRVFSDALNHASIVDGCRLARATVEVLPHGSVDALRDGIGRPCAGRSWVVAEGLYSMDGDRVDLAGYLGAMGRVGGSMIVDEAHAIGVLGPDGGGVSAEQGVQRDVIRVGTFGKALGSHGAFVLCDAAVRQLLVNGARSFLYTTALPPASVAAARAALTVVRQERWRQRRVLRHARRLWDGVRALGFHTSDAPSPIVPVVVGGEADCVTLAARLLRRGYFARAIRPPTVPEHTCRLRLSVSAVHTAEQIDGLLAALGEEARALQLAFDGAEPGGDEGIP